MPKSKCAVWWCNNEHYALGLCKPHWEAVRRYGSPYGKNKEKFVRINDAIDKAILVAEFVTEFAQTEFDQDRICPFCHYPNSKFHHYDACIVHQAKDFLSAVIQEN